MAREPSPSRVSSTSKFFLVTAERVKGLVGCATTPAPDLVPPAVDLHVYDVLLTEVAV